MAKYHISPSTGKPNICRAHSKPCPIGGADDHYPTKEAAQKGFEKAMSEQTMTATKVDAGARKAALKAAEPKWVRLREVEATIEAANEAADKALRDRAFFQKARTALEAAQEAEARPVEDYKYGESNKRGTVHSYANSAIEALRRTEPWQPNRMSAWYPDHEYKSLEDIDAKVSTSDADNEMRLQDISDDLENLEAERDELKAEVVAATGFAENPRYGVPTGETTKEKWAGKQAGNYSNLPSKDVAVLKDAKRFCTRCGDAVERQGEGYSASLVHSGGGSECDDAKVEARTGQKPQWKQYVTSNSVCRYCGTGDPAHSKFEQKSYSDESSCSRCGGVSGYGIGD